MAAAIPLIGYALLWSEELSRFFVLRDALGQGIWTDTTGRIKLLYFGAILLSVAWFIFVWRCPNSIKIFDRLDDYLFQQMQIHDHTGFEKVRNTVQEWLVMEDVAPAAKGWAAEVPVTLSQSISPARAYSALRSPTGENKSTIYKSYYLFANGSRFGSALLVAVFFFVGAFFVALPSLEVFLLVVTKIDLL